MVRIGPGDVIGGTVLPSASVAVLVRSRSDDSVGSVMMGVLAPPPRTCAPSRSVHWICFTCSRKKFKYALP